MPKTKKPKLKKREISSKSTGTKFIDRCYYYRSKYGVRRENKFIKETASHILGEWWDQYQWYSVPCLKGLVYYYLVEHNEPGKMTEDMYVRWDCLKEAGVNIELVLPGDALNFASNGFKTVFAKEIASTKWNRRSVIKKKRSIIKKKKR